MSTSFTASRLRRFTAVLSATALLAGGLSLVAPPPAVAADPRTFALVGDLQSELGCSGDWQPDCAETELQPTDDPDVYAAEFEVPAGSWSYKVAVNDAWDESYGLNGGGDDIPLTVAGPSTLRFLFDDSTHRVGLEAASLRAGYSADDDALVAEPVRQAGAGEQFYFVMTDRFANGDTANDEGGLTGDRLSTGFDPTSSGFYNGGDIAGLRAQLDYIKGLGTTAIWLTPSFRNKPVQGEGDNASAGYHGYWITDFTQIDPHLGTNAELEAFIDDAHAEGIDVYFDIITNHTADVISYEEGQYSYIDQETSPYRDASGTAFDPADYAGTGDFPDLDAATSFPYTPVVSAAEADVKVPAWLNDVTLYHNRGDSTYSGESTTFGDFAGLDDLMTEHPDVVSGFVDVYQDWIDLGIDGFRIDTAKHVDFAFWKQWTTEVLDYAHAQGKDDFFMFGEVYDADPAALSPYVRGTDMNSVLDFGFQSAATSFAKGGNVSTLAKLFAGDDRYTTTDSSATALPTFLGNHDMGRIGYFLKDSDDAVRRDLLAHDLLFLSRGQPVVYYGDEQGFAGAGAGNDKSARQSLFASEVAEYRDQTLLTGETVGSADRYDTDAPLYTHIAALADLREAHPALVDGAQIERYAADGVYAFSRVDPTDRVEYLVALNNTDSAATVDVPTLTADAAFTGLYGETADTASDAAAVASVTVPALSAVVLRADGSVTAPAEAAPLTVSVPEPGAALTGSAPVAASTDQSWRQTSFAWRVVGSDEWHPLGTAESTSPRVFHDVGGLADGTLVEYRAVSTDAAGQRSAASTYASAGNRIALAAVEEPEEPTEPTAYDFVSIPGNLNSEMGCAGDWAPDCDEAQMELVDGIWRLTVDLPAGDYEYKVATEKSWDENYGADGVAGGANIAISHDGGSITFYFDPLTKRAQSTAEGPVVTLPGSFQSEIGCAADWSPDCLRSLMLDGDRDGVYEFATDRIPTGSYELKVAHGLSWDENYGANGVRDGGNISFSATEGKRVVFRYDVSTHVLEIEVADPPLAGTGESRAHWIDATTIAWPQALGAAAADATWALYGSRDAGLAVEEGEVVGGDAPLALEPVEGGLTDDQKERFPALASFTALRVPADRAAVAELLRGQLRVAQRDADGALAAFTGVQIPGVLDDLYADAVDDDVLGVTFPRKGAKASPAFRLWAPTAQAATLLTWPAGSDGDPVRHPASFDAAAGTWTVAAGARKGDEYLWEVVVYAPTTDAIETNTVTDPYSVGLTLNSTRSVAVDLRDKNWMPKVWQKAKAPRIERAVDRAIYELHIRDFSITDETVPEQERGTYLAFARDSAGTTQLRQLADAGINTVHLLPSFDIATIEEDRAAQETPDCDLASFGPASTEQQACVEAVADTDGFNWGYDPFHFSTPEGSYAVEADGGSRVAEFRTMVGSLHGMGLQVVLDEVFNHTAASGQADRSVLDRVVPGYYHRLNAAGGVETSTCCQNVATEHEVAQKLMVDSVVTWARDYKVDGFRFDLMGHHSKENMLAIRDALDGLTLKKDGVDGKAIYLYGEGWNFGEVADNALFEQATQGQLGGTGIGTFSDRLRDAVHGGSPVDSGSTFRQGYGTGLGTDPNGDGINGTTEQALADLARQTDLVKLGLAGNLRDFVLTTADGSVKTGAELDYNGQSAGYADQPDEIISYVDAHDNETLYDLSVLKLPRDTSMSDRVRMNTLSLATATLSQTPSFWHAGTELLRSKSLDRNSYNSGDWFNRIDWTGQESTFGSGLPRAADNGEKWSIMAPLLADPALKPGADDIATAEAAALDLLRVRSEVGLLRLGSAERIEQKVSFPASGPDATPGVIVMQIDDLVGADADPALDGALVVFNASPEETTQVLPELAGRGFALTPAQAKGADPVVKTTSWTAASGTVTVPARTVAVLVDAAPAKTVTKAAPTRLIAKKGTPVRVVGTVVAADRSAPVGAITVTDGAKTIASVALPASAKGKIDIALPTLSRGVHLLRVAFTGGSDHRDSRSSVRPLIVY
ncbi:MAG: pullulanase-type alpha-1,6-glucosidase [Candidatus Microbacterium phytovorans]|uniref:Pullulanase-type alpha-1,6-glucosidase n=1 Tax=Candidatus Microbacterium phytovorans TaxID=3121374 RepID=A0AAJ5VYR1_9MICO|nr:pullulanase-type alpha-1,6-glucosidase [Microbacterium sp.]WEK12851.1 MAG: pullulanase-type alpha-1,6-glucosidase [Microbacterium sp.]